DYGDALEGYKRLRQVFEASSHLRLAQKLLSLDPGRPVHPQVAQSAREEIHAALLAFDRIAQRDPRAQAADRAVRDLLESLRRQVTAPDDGADPAAASEALRDGVGDVLSKIPALVAGIGATTEASQQAAVHRRQFTIATVAGLCGIVVIAAVVLGVLQH